MNTTEAAAPTQIFISYSSRDRAVADSVRAHLRDNDIACWMAPHDILGGSDWASAIIDAIDESRALLLVLSEASNVSDEVKREVGRASHRGIPIVPFFIESVVLSKHMEYFLATTHWLGADTRHVELRMAHLVDTVRGLLKVPAASSAARNERSSQDAPSPPRAMPATGQVPAEILRLEERFLDAMRPLLRFPRADVSPIRGQKPTLAGGVALGIGALGILFNFQSLLGVVAPGTTSPESFLYAMFPLVRFVALIAVAASAIGNVGLMAGGHRALSGMTDGVGVTLASAKWLAAVLGIWLVATIVVTMMSGPEQVRGMVINGAFATAVIAGIQIALVWKLASMARAQIEA